MFHVNAVYLFNLLGTTESTKSSFTFTRSLPLSRHKIDLTGFYGTAFSDNEREIIFNDNHMYDNYISEFLQMCSWSAFLNDYSNDMNCYYVLVFSRNPPLAKHIGHFSVRSCYSQLIASNSEVAFVFDGNIIEFGCYVLFCKLQ